MFQVWAGEGPLTLTSSPRLRAHLAPTPASARRRRGPPLAWGTEGPLDVLSAAEMARTSPSGTVPGVLRAVPEPSALSILDTEMRTRWWPQARFCRKRQCECLPGSWGELVPPAKSPRAGLFPHELSPGMRTQGDLVTTSCF